MSEQQPLNGHLNDRLDSLLAGLAGVHTSIDDERNARLTDAVARDEENLSRDKRTHRVTVFALIAALLGVIGLGVGGIGITRASSADEKAAQAQATATAVLEARTAAQKVTCDQANVQAVKHNSLADALDQILILAVVPNPSSPARTADQDAAAKAFYDKAHALVDGARDLGRDCSPEGIDKFYNGG